MENYHPYEAHRCSLHHERPAEGRCQGCGEYFCSECLDSHGSCPACSQAAERFLEGFSTALSRWEAGLRNPELIQASDTTALMDQLTSGCHEQI